jgi:hypothetical protein
MEFDYVKFINEGYEAQEKYAKRIDEPGPSSLVLMEKINGELKPDDLQFRYAKVIEHFGHLIEEAIEARVYVPRRSWKNGERSYLDSPELREEFVAEMYDILLFHRAILAYAGVSGEEFAEIAAEKQAYNQTRKDHNVNGDERVSASPSEELAGNCASAGFANNSYDRD